MQNDWTVLLEGLYGRLAQAAGRSTPQRVFIVDQLCKVLCIKYGASIAE